MIDFEPFLVSFKLAGITTLVLFLLCLLPAWYLSRTKSKLKPFIEAFVSLPLVLPPSVIGFYILITLSSSSPLGVFLHETFNVKLAFSFTGLIVASCIYSLPFMFQPLQSGFEALKKNVIEASYLSGKNTLQTIVFVALPNIIPNLMTALIITFAHTVGEFGVVLMVGGSIPGETKVASVAIYEFVENLDYKYAHIYSLIMVLISFAVLLAVYFFNHVKALKR